MKISNASKKLFETHHLMYSGLMSWRLKEGLWQLNLELSDLSSKKLCCLDSGLKGNLITLYITFVINVIYNFITFFM